MISKDITQTLISNGEIQKRIAGIFPDYVMLDNHFRFLSISQNILEATGYSVDELIGTSIGALSSTSDLTKQLEQKLTSGFFEDAQFEINTRSRGTVMYSISGFYLGLVADINGVVMLKMRNIDEINLTYENLESRTTELDRFVYLSAHALRGPLATIKGLVNLAQKCDDKEEMNFLLTQIKTFADRLDEKLHRLIYFAEADKEEESSTVDLTLHYIIAALNTTLREGGADFPVQYECVTKDQAVVLPHGGSILSLLRNIGIFFLQQQKIISNSLLLDVHVGEGATEILIRARGFTLEESLREKLRMINFGYSEILNFPELINCYAAKKIMFKLKGQIQFILAPLAEVVVHITIPRDEK